MKTLWRLLLFPLCCAASCFILGTFPSTAAEAAQGFQDPLDTPAIKQSNPSRKPLLAIAAAGDRLVAVGARGLIITSSDDGQTWQQSEVPVQTDLVAVDFPTATKGWAVGHDGVILFSEDGGSTWEKHLDGRLAQEQFERYYEERVATAEGAAEAALQDTLDLTIMNYSDGPQLPYLAVEFVDDLRGWVVGAFGQSATTGDGGATWQPALHRINNDPPLMLYDIERIGDDLYIASERGVVYRWSTESRRFEVIDTGYDGTFLGVTGNASVVVAFGLVGTLYRSDDRGNTWAQVPIPTESTLNAGTRLGDGRGFIFVTQTGEILLSDRDATQFEIRTLEQPMPLTDVLPVSDKTALVLGLGGIQSVDLSPVADEVASGREN